MSFPDFSKISLDLAPTGQGPKRDPWLTPEGLTVATSYGAEALEGLAHQDGLPGFAPVRRGPYPTMYAGNTWTNPQYAGFSTAEAFCDADSIPRNAQSVSAMLEPRPSNRPSSTSRPGKSRKA